MGVGWGSFSWTFPAKRREVWWKEMSRAIFQQFPVLPGGVKRSTRPEVVRAVRTHLKMIVKLDGERWSHYRVI